MHVSLWVLLWVHMTWADNMPKHTALTQHICVAVSVASVHTVPMVITYHMILSPCTSGLVGVSARNVATADDRALIVYAIMVHGLPRVCKWNNMNCCLASVMIYLAMTLN